MGKTANKISILDIGTHHAQELRVLFGDYSYILPTFLTWWIDWGKRQVKKLIRYDGLIEYGTGAYVRSPLDFPVSFHMKCLLNALRKPDADKRFVVISLDPLAHVTPQHVGFLERRVKFYYLPIAVFSHKSDQSCGLVSFDIGVDDLSSSLDTNPSKIAKTVACAGLRPKQVIDELESLGILDRSAPVIARMNCEGAELAVMQGLVDSNLVVAGVMGSLKDVGKKYGEADAAKLDDLLLEQGVESYYFKGSDPSTWQHGIGYFAHWCEKSAEQG